MQDEVAPADRQTLAPCDQLQLATELDERRREDVEQLWTACALSCRVADCVSYDEGYLRATLALPLNPY
jgi:hypothetical protein